MTEIAVTLPQSDQKRLARLAKAAGRTPRSMLRFILRDGFEEVERCIEAVATSRLAAEQGQTVPHDQAMKALRNTIAKRAKKAA